MSIYEILPGTILRSSIRMCQLVRFFIFRIPFLGIVTRYDWRYSHRAEHLFESQISMRFSALGDKACQYLSQSTVSLGILLNIPVNPPPFRGSLPHKSLISRMDWVSCTGDINLPHTPFPPARSTPNKKIKYNKIFTYILRSIFLEIHHLELLR
jgi:hypothetical protein